MNDGDIMMWKEGEKWEVVERVNIKEVMVIDIE